MIEAHMFNWTLRGRVAVVTLNRPPVNAISEEWGSAFLGLLDELDARDDWTVLQLRSEQRVFAAGADLAQIQSWFSEAQPAQRLRDYLVTLQAVFERLESLSRPSLAEIGGAALGGGFELALACDLRIAAHEAKLGLPEVGIGLIPGIGGTQRLTRLVGRGTAARMIYTAEAVDGASAQAMGLVQWAVPRTDLSTKAASIADRLSGLPLPALKAAKELVTALGPEPTAGYALERSLGGALLLTPEAQALITAFVHKAPQLKP